LLQKEIVLLDVKCNQLNDESLERRALIGYCTLSDSEESQGDRVLVPHTVYIATSKIKCKCSQTLSKLLDGKRAIGSLLNNPTFVLTGCSKDENDRISRKYTLEDASMLCEIEEVFQIPFN
jgi:hypothetical protein